MSFSIAERRLPLGMPRIGPKVVERLEAAGFDSLHKINQQGVDAVVRVICDSLGGSAWNNRRLALAAALLCSESLEAARGLKQVCFRSECS